MTEPLPDTWHNRDLPVLRETARLLEAAEIGQGVRLADIATATGLSEDDTFRALKTLEHEYLIEARWMMPARAGRVVKISGDARRIVGLWPTPVTAFDRIVAQLERIASGDTPDREPAAATLQALNAAGDSLRRSIGAAALGEDQ